MAAKILSVDIETFPMLYYAWRPWEGRALEVLEYSKIVSYSAKWLDGSQVTKALPDFNNNEKALIKSLWKLIDEADVVVAHNGKAFDFGRMNSAFVKHGLTPPSPSHKVDTKRVAKEVFGFDSNSLADLVQFLGLGEKMATGGYELWQKCREGNQAAWAKMKKYNAHDTVLLEKVYLTLRPWMRRHPNLNLYTEGEVCPTCGGPDTKIQKRGTYKAETRTYQRYQCMSCSAWLKESKAITKTRLRHVG